MKTTIKKMTAQEVEFELPLYFKNKYCGVSAVLSPTKAITVKDGFVWFSDDNSEHLVQNLLSSDYVAGNEITKEEFEIEFNALKMQLNDFEL